MLQHHAVDNPSAERAPAAERPEGNAVRRLCTDAEARSRRRSGRRRGRGRRSGRRPRDGCGCWSGDWLRRRRRRWLWRRRWGGCWACVSLLADALCACPHELVSAGGAVVVVRAISTHTLVVALQARKASAISVIIRSIAECRGAARIWARRRRRDSSRRRRGITSNVELLVVVIPKQSRERVCPCIGQEDIQDLCIVEGRVLLEHQGRATSHMRASHGSAADCSAGCVVLVANRLDVAAGGPDVGALTKI